MFTQLEQVEKRYNELQMQLCDTHIVQDVERYRQLIQESNTLSPIVEKYREWMHITTQQQDAAQLMESAELRELAEEEYQILCKAQTICEQELRALLLPQDPNDERNVILEIRAGAGGEESALFAASLFRMYSMYNDRNGFRTEIISVNETELRGYKEIVATIIGRGAYSRLKFESGVHRVQRVPETESGGRIHTSTATVVVLPEADEVELHIDPTELQIDTFRASGAGGQHINKTESAIRITHLPTGTVVECQDERSQYKNKDKAMRVLRSRLLEAKQKEQQDAISTERRSQVGTGNRNERIRTYNFPQGRVTDHRIGLTLHRINSIMDGNLDEIIDALITADRTQQLQHSEEAL